MERIAKHDFRLAFDRNLKSLLATRLVSQIVEAGATPVLFYSVRIRNAVFMSLKASKLGPVIDLQRIVPLLKRLHIDRITWSDMPLLLNLITESRNLKQFS